ncbi:H(+)-transporting V0 sector ATPase subunit a [Marasmius sp. AFHP31]|nr:H(+)-transporting V0 sector ATPase subunit a [Marasmius sp. AFHP31]
MSHSEEDHYPDSLRSEEMSMIQLFVPTEVAHDTVHALGVLGIVQFRDLNPNVNPSQRAFVGEIRRFEEIGRQIRFLMDHIRRENDEVTVQVLEDTSLPISREPLSPQSLDELEETIRGREVRLTQMNDSCQKLAERKKSLLERISVLHETVVFFDQPSMQMEVRNSLDQHSANTPLLLHGQPRDQESQPVGMQEGSSFTIGFVAGVIERSRASTLERVLWRSLRGNLFMKYLDVSEPFDDPVSGSRSYKSVFIVFVSGDVLSSKVAKICDLMGASLYPITSNSSQRSSALQVLTAELEDTEVVLSGAVSERRDLLRTIAWEVNGWEEIVRREKKIYEALNLFDYDARRRTLIADGWAPTRDIPTIQMAIHIAAEESGSDVRPVIHKVRTTATPPTFFRTNKFTESFQTIMDSYGTAAYQEINGGLFSIVTLPFMFAVMFGDVGHAGTILLAAIWMIRNERTFMKAFSKSDYKEISSRLWQFWMELPRDRRWKEDYWRVHWSCLPLRVGPWMAWCHQSLGVRELLQDEDVDHTRTGPCAYHVYSGRVAIDCRNE